jgi:hypothetical protein
LNSLVGKNQILEFSEIILVTNAQQGFFVAKNFGKYGIAQAKKESRIKLIKAHDYKIDISPFPESYLYFRDRGKKHVNIDLFEKGNSFNTESRRVELTENAIKNIFLNGNRIDLREYFMTLADSMCEEHINKKHIHLLNANTYKYSIKKEINYQNEDSLVIDNTNIAKVMLSVDFEIQIAKPIVKSNFLIENRGRFIDLEYIIPSVGQLNLLITGEILSAG